MRLQVNGEEHSFAGTLTLAALIEQLGMRADRVAVELNRDIVARDRWPATELREGDRLEIVHFVGGGCSPFAGDCFEWAVGMRSYLALAGILLALTAPPSAQNPPATQEAPAPSAQPCRDDRPVEEYMAELNKSKKQRNKNPLPTGVCLGSLCAGKAGAPPPEKAPPPASPQPKRGVGAAESSSQETAAEAGGEEPLHDPMAAAQSVEVGDFYFGDKKYRAALSRYRDALEAKPDDAAIYLRLGRTFERLEEPERAYENYDASRIAEPAGPSADEAGRSAERLRPEVEKRGGDPGAISARNRARIVPRCRTEAPTASAPPR